MEEGIIQIASGREFSQNHQQNSNLHIQVQQMSSRINRNKHTIMKLNIKDKNEDIKREAEITYKRIALDYQLAFHQQDLEDHRIILSMCGGKKRNVKRMNRQTTD